MKVLIATNDLQGAEPGDYSWTVEGELVTAVVEECASGDRCGCARGWPGLASARPTTTAMVVDRPGITEDDLRDAIFDWLDRGGDVAVIREIAELADDDDDESEGWEDPDVTIAAIIDEHVEVIRSITANFPEGTLVCRKGTQVYARTMPSAA
jgi:hypothetical protein